MKLCNHPSGDPQEVPEEDPDDDPEEEEEPDEVMQSLENEEEQQMHEDKHVISPLLFPYRQGLGIPHTRKPTENSIPIHKRIRKKQPSWLLGIQRPVADPKQYDPFHEGWVQNDVQYFSFSFDDLERRTHNLTRLASFVNKWLSEQGGTHRCEVGLSLGKKPLTPTETEALSLQFTRTLRLGYQVKIVSEEMRIIEANDSHVTRGCRGWKPK